MNEFKDEFNSKHKVGRQPETELALAQQEITWLWKKCEDIGHRCEKLEKRQSELEKSYNTLIVRGTTLFALITGAGVLIGWLATLVNNAKGIIGK